LGIQWIRTIRRYISFSLINNIDGTIIDKTNPVAVVDSNAVLTGKSFNAISAGTEHVVLLTTDGKVFTWGGNM
jgi:alpha-tubulin suppressor-like RCC1 family protein